MRALLSIFLLAALLGACSEAPVLDIDKLEARARAGRPEAIDRLVELLGGGDEALADRAYAILVEVGPATVPALRAKIAATDRQQREYVIAALGTLKVAAAVPQIGDVLTSATLDRRYVAAWALGEIGDPAGVPVLIAALDDSNGEVRRYATRALIKLNARSVGPLIAFLQEAEGEGAAGAIRALGDIADPQALPVLLAKADGPQRGEVFLALGKLRDRRAEQALIAGLTDADWRVRMNAAMALGPLGDQAAVEPLQTTLEDETHVVREWSARSLEMITGHPVEYRNSKGEMVRPYNVYH